MFKMVHDTTGQPTWSSNSIIGIIDIMLMNWGNDPGFTLIYDDETKKLIVNGVSYTLKYIPYENNRGDLNE